MWFWLCYEKACESGSRGGLSTFALFIPCFLVFGVHPERFVSDGVYVSPFQDCPTLLLESGPVVPSQSCDAVLNCFLLGLCPVVVGSFLFSLPLPVGYKLRSVS